MTTATAQDEVRYPFRQASYRLRHGTGGKRREQGRAILKRQAIRH